MPQRLDNVSDEVKREFEPFRPAIEETLGGFLPNSLFAMAHNPDLVIGFGLLSRAVFRGSGKTRIRPWTLLTTAIRQGWRRLRTKPEPPISDELRALVFLSVSLSAGCRYCQAHSTLQAIDRSIPQEKVAAIITYADSPLFTPAEKATLDLSFAAGRVPNEAKDAHFAALRQHFSTAQITDIVAAIAFMGFLNRWNDTLATRLEPAPAQAAKQFLPGWTIGRHGP